MKPKDFILIYPPTYTRALEIPYGGIYLADSLIKKGYSVGLINEYTEKDVLKLIENYGGESTIAFGLSVVSGPVIEDAIYIARYIRSHFPDKPIIWGGPHVTALPEQSLKSQFVDYIVWGEGEVSLPKLLDSIEKNRSLEHIDGIGYINEYGENIVSKDSGYTSLDGIFNLPYHLLPMEPYYRKLNIGGERWISVLYSRGCPYKCAFCINSSERWSNSLIRFHSIDHIIKDLKTFVHEYNADGITILDDHFFIQEKRLVEVCERILKENIKVKFRANGRIDAFARLSERTYELLKEIGLISIGAGIESGSPRMLKYINKNITLDEIDKVDTLFSKFQIYKHWNFMTAFPGETIEDIKLTIKLIIKLAYTSFDSPFPFSSYNRFIPLPGTKLFIVAKEYGMKAPENLDEWTSFSQKYKFDGQGYDPKIWPWITKEVGEFMFAAECLVHELNSHYTGIDANTENIKKTISKLNSLIK